MSYRRSFNELHEAFVDIFILRPMDWALKLLLYIRQIESSEEPKSVISPLPFLSKP